jgi:hypothetical protein
MHNRAYRAAGSHARTCFAIPVSLFENCIRRLKRRVRHRPAGYVGTARLNVDIIESYESPVVSCLRVCV